MSDADGPRHVAIIADGNRRWARDRGLPVLARHVQGIEAIRPIVRRARDSGVETLSVYTFSTENWTRPNDEVSGLFGLIVNFALTITVSLATAPPPKEIQDMVDDLRIPVGEGDLSTAGILAAVGVAVTSLAGAVLGGIAGMRFHRRVDRAGFDEI